MHVAGLDVGRRTFHGLKKEIILLRSTRTMYRDRPGLLPLGRFVRWGDVRANAATNTTDQANGRKSNGPNHENASPFIIRYRLGYWRVFDTDATPLPFIGCHRSELIQGWLVILLPCISIRSVLETLELPNFL
jgi:hypothetical protein